MSYNKYFLKEATADIGAAVEVVVLPLEPPRWQSVPPH
jgi:hypothetical protein